jgi:hypothetical protein
LDTAEGEGDQLDVKSLQNQLEKTQDLVGQLSKQLMELKDQVKNFFACFSLAWPKIHNLAETSTKFQYSQNSSSFSPNFMHFFFQISFSF